MNKYKTIEAATAAMKKEYQNGDPVCVVGTISGFFLIVNLYSAIAYNAKIFAQR